VEDLYTNNLRNQEFGKKAPQIFCPARVVAFKDSTRALGDVSSVPHLQSSRSW